MYFHSETAVAARLAALDHVRLASTIVLDSTERLVDLYNGAGSRVLGLARSGEPVTPPAFFGSLMPELVAGHLRIAGHIHEDWVRLLEAQMHNSGRLAKFALDKAANLSPPLMEMTLEAAESIVATGEDVADALGDATVRAVQDVEKQLERTLPPKGRKSRSQRR